MSIATRFSALVNNVIAQRIVCFGVLPVALGSLSATIHQDKLDAPARTADYNAAQVVAKELSVFGEKAKGGEEALVEAYNSRKTYLNAPANDAIVGCMRTALLPEHGSIEIAQTVPQTKMTSYRAPMATDLQYANTSTVAVVNFSKTTLTDCAQAAFVSHRDVPTAAQSRTSFYKEVGNGLLLGTVLGVFGYNQLFIRRRDKAAKPAAPTQG